MRRLAFILTMLFLASPSFAAGVSPLPLNLQADRVVIEKSRHQMTLYRDGKPLRSYRVALGSGGLGPKRRQSDHLTPEGLYRIDGRNPHSGYHMALHISYPNASDIATAAARGDKPGGDIMIHGIRNGFGFLGDRHRETDWTAGCIATTDNEIEEIWKLVPNGTPVEIKP